MSNRRILPALAATLALLVSIPSAAARESQIEARELQPLEDEEWLEREERLLTQGTFTPYINALLRTEIYNRGLNRSIQDNVAWQSFCSYWYGFLESEIIDILTLQGAYFTCMDIASANQQTKKNWLDEYFALG